jgi:acetoin utilization protein AcuB
MLSKDLISPSVPELTLTDSADKALQLMSDYHLVQLPLVFEGKYLGLISEDALLDWDDTSITFGMAYSNYLKPAVPAHAHIYEALKIYTEIECAILPVVDADDKYIGAITTETLLQYTIQGTQCAESGGTIVISCSDTNYSLSQISRLFESENITILSVLVHTFRTADRTLMITIKTNKQDLRAVGATLERLNYTIEEVHSEINDTADLKSNFDLLMKYLDV